MNHISFDQIDSIIYRLIYSFKVIKDKKIEKEFSLNIASYEKKKGEDFHSDSKMTINPFLGIKAD